MVVTLAPIRTLTWIVFALFVVPGLGYAQSTPAPAGADPVEWIRPEEIPERADALLRRLDTGVRRAAVEAMVERIQNGLATLGPQLDAEIEEADGALGHARALGDLEDLRRALAGYATPLSDWRSALDGEVKHVAAMLDEVAQAQRVWSATQGRPETAAAGDVMVRRVGSALAALDDTAVQLRALRGRVLALSDRLLDRNTALEAMRDKLRMATVAEGESLLVPDSPPLWRRDTWAAVQSELPRVPEQIRISMQRTAGYIRSDTQPFMVQALTAVLLMLVLSTYSKTTRQHLAGSDVSAQTARFLERPYAIAILLALMLTPLLHPLAPQRVRQMLGAIALVPAARIAIHASERANVAVFVALFIFMLLDRMGVALAALPGITRAIFLCELLVTIALAVWFTRRTSPAEWTRRATMFVVAVLGFALLAEIGGWTDLATVLGRGIAASALIGMYVYIAVITVDALLASAWGSPTLQRSRLVGDNLQLLHRRAQRLLRGLGVGLWLYLVLAAIGLRSTVFDAVQAILQVGVSVGALSLSLGGVLAFVLALVMARIVALIVNGVLEVEVYPRASLPRGLPDALSTLVRYGIFAIGFLFALAAAGVQLGQVTVLLGGLGIGIGLGLQDLVKDFAAGLTILLERRVHVGDAIEISGVSGRVRTIGMRSGVVRTWNGADVVVPNSTLLSGTVTNWALLDRLCRVEVAVGVAYGTDPDRVVALLLDVARSLDRVIADPPPQALFTAFGDNALNFVLRAWTEEGYDQTASLISELGLAVHRALGAAGISIPFPQRDLHIESLSAGVHAALRERNEKA